MGQRVGFAPRRTVVSVEEIRRLEGLRRREKERNRAEEQRLSARIEVLEQRLVSVKRRAAKEARAECRAEHEAQLRAVIDEREQLRTALSETEARHASAQDEIERLGAELRDIRQTVDNMRSAITRARRRVGDAIGAVGSVDIALGGLDG